MTSTGSIMRLLHTVRYLRARQVVGQVRNRLRCLVEQPAARTTRPIPESEECRWRPRREFLPPGPQENSPDQILEGKLVFLNNVQKVGWPPEFNGDRQPKLWRYNLHYFEYLWALEFGQAKAAVLNWIEEHPLRRGNVGWEPYPTSLRLVNWCCVFFGKFKRQTEANRQFRNILWRSIFLQAQWLCRHLETHLLGNHLFENGATLLMLGCCFDGASARRWYRRGMNVLAEEIPEQILADGGHFERSPMYHSRVLYLLLLLESIGDRKVDELVRPSIIRMQEALSNMLHPDGRIALLNDSALGIYNEPRQLIDPVDDLLDEPASEGPASEPTCLPKMGPFALPETGYYGIRTKQGHYAICDAGPIGPDYIPGHAHGDVFSFELSLGGHRVIVDSGVYDYQPGEMRRYCRSTGAHNTVEVEGRDQSEFWGAFRVARRGRVRDVVWQPAENGFRLAAWHDGYRRLPGAARHRREFIWHDAQRLEVNDRITADREVAAVARLHLHPSCRVAEVSQNSVQITYPAGRFVVRFCGEGVLTREESLYCPEFGKKINNTALAFSVRGSDVSTGFRIEW